MHNVNTSVTNSCDIKFLKGLQRVVGNKVQYEGNTQDFKTQSKSQNKNCLLREDAMNGNLGATFTK